MSDVMNEKSALVNLLSIAGSDPSGGAGIQADLKTCCALGAYGMAAVTALTAQNTRGVRGSQIVEADFIYEQLEAVFNDIRVDGVKIGMLGDEHAARVVVDTLLRYKPRVVVLDPVLVSTSGYRLTSEAAMQVIISDLAPLASIVTPNMPEGEAMLRRAFLNPEDDVRALSDHLGGVPVLLKGGHSQGAQSTDYLCAGAAHHGRSIKAFSHQRIETRNTHGTGCTLSSALACFMAQGLALEDAVAKAKVYVSGAIAAADSLNVGSGEGHGPLHHGYKQGAYGE